jgi:hypothetical protein
MSEATKPEYETPFATGPTVQLLVWRAEQPRNYAATIEVWKTRARDWLSGKTRWLTTSFESTGGVVFLTAVGRERLR